MKSLIIFAMGISLFSATSYAEIQNCRVVRTFDAYGNLTAKRHCGFYGGNALIVEERSPSWGGFEPREGDGHGGANGHGSN
jgi:hypothetical protein